MFDDSTEIRLINVILPLHLPKALTYALPASVKEFPEAGMRVVVPLKKKLYTGLVVGKHDQIPLNYKPRDIEYVLDDKAIVTSKQLQFFQWLVDYYMSFPGDVLQAALPAVFKLSSTTYLSLAPEFDFEGPEWSHKEEILLRAISNKGHLTISEASEILQQKNIHKLISNLVEREALVASEELKTLYKPKLLPFAKLSDEYLNDETLGEAMDKLSKAPVQERLLLSFLQSNPHFEAQSKKLLLKRAEASDAAYKALEKKGIFKTIHIKQDRVAINADSVRALPALVEDQEEAVKVIREAWEDKEVCLLHGVTSSGKTRVYMEFIDELLNANKQVLYMLPEIGLTTQLVKRLSVHFGGKMGVYHSRMSDNERAEIWKKTHDGEIGLILGVRSSVFLPFENLALVVVDEEHDQSLKQYDPSPRYHGRDAAIYLAWLHDAKVLLGSATPSLESYYLARNSKYGMAELIRRYNNVPMPEIKMSDVKEAEKSSQLKEHFTVELLAEIKHCLERKKQVILLQNRRGYTPVQECEDCSWVPMCKNCDIPLNYHKTKGTLSCHYCGYSTLQIEACLSCGSTRMRAWGFGTEKVEEALAELLPEANIVRLDQDTARRKHTYSEVMTRFEEGEIDILIGTQMVSKGLDFENVHLVGVLNSDRSLYFPDFRANEKTYQLLSQVSGRAGRLAKQGRVLLQTRQPGHPIFKNVLDQDYFAMYYNELRQRENYHYPPFYRLLKITLKHKSYELVQEAATLLTQHIKQVLRAEVMGPATPSIARIRSLYLQELMIKFRRNDKNLFSAKAAIRTAIQSIEANKLYKSVRVVIDVDPA